MGGYSHTMCKHSRIEMEKTMIRPILTNAACAPKNLSAPLQSVGITAPAGESVKATLRSLNTKPRAFDILCDMFGITKY